MAVVVSSPAFVSGDDFPADYGEWFLKDRRRAVVLLRRTSFPGPYIIVEEAFRFIDWLLDSGWSLWLFGSQFHFLLSIIRFDYKSVNLLEYINPKTEYSAKPASAVAVELQDFIVSKKDDQNGC
ncbi:hypothetical protein Ddye_014057 [Dipteronia dyeriana]|uniref:Uncharacterized protein n=1 Tax=Dipteronia dyeriana TaxID=168575 RepID=A0AAD9X7Q2_9ROSI|nr:hypothetical protein Ddye_014057 [Dipteronia dyeriana]